jgi:hypothetical protein
LHAGDCGAVIGRGGVAIGPQLTVSWSFRRKHGRQALQDGAEFVLLQCKMIIAPQYAARDRAAGAA